MMRLRITKNSEYYKENNWSYEYVQNTATLERLVEDIKKNEGKCSNINTLSIEERQELSMRFWKSNIARIISIEPKDFILNGDPFLDHWYKSPSLQAYSWSGDKNYYDKYQTNNNIKSYSKEYTSDVVAKMCFDDFNFDIHFNNLYSLLDSSLEDKKMECTQWLIFQLKNLIFERLYIKYIITGSEINFLKQFLDSYFYYCSKIYMDLLDSFQKHSDKISTYRGIFIQFYFFKQFYDGILQFFKSYYYTKKSIFSYKETISSEYCLGSDSLYPGFYEYHIREGKNIIFNMSQIIECDAFDKIYSFWTNLLPLNSFLISIPAIKIDHSNFIPNCDPENYLYLKPEMIPSIEIIDGWFGEGKTKWFRENAPEGIQPVEQDELIRELYFMLKNVELTDDDDIRQIEPKHIFKQNTYRYIRTNMISYFFHRFMPTLFSLTTLRYLTFSNNYYASKALKKEELPKKIFVDRSFVSNTVFQTIGLNYRADNTTFDCLLARVYNDYYNIFLFNIQMQYLYYSKKFLNCYLATDNSYNEKYERLYYIYFRTNITSLLKDFDFYKSLKPFHDHRTMERDLYDTDFKFEQAYERFKFFYKNIYYYYYPIFVNGLLD